MTRNLALGFLASFVLGAACTGGGNASSGTDGECPVASEGCPCTGGGVCDPGLECVDDICEGPDACPVGSAGCPCTGGGACDPNLTCEMDICRLPDGCAVGSQGCSCTGGGACDPGLQCMTDVCVPDGSGGTTGNTTNTTSSSDTNTTDPTAGTTTDSGTTGNTTNPTDPTNTTDPTATTTATATATTGNTTGGACTAGEKGCECVAGTCDGGLMCQGDVCMTSASPLAHWNFQNNPNDVSGNGFHGFEVGPITYEAGVDGLAAVLGGQSHFNVSAFTTTFEGIQSAFTVTMRINITDYWGELAIHLFGRGSQGENLDSNSFGVWMNNAMIWHQTETGANGSNAISQIYSPSPATGSWIDMVFVYQDPFLWYYQNGQLLGDGIVYTAPDTNSPQMWIGGFPAVGESLKGKIDDVQVFNGALTQ